MSSLQLPIARRLAALAGAAALAAGLGACSLDHKVAHPHYADVENFYVDAGPITYQVQLTRELNQYTTEDKQFLNGVSSSSLSPSQLWFAVFMWARNQTKQNQTTSDHFTITDSAGNVYNPVPIDSSVNQYAWTSQVLPPGQVEPGPDTTASLGTTQGGVILFKLPDSVFSNRPLTLHIFASPKQTAMVSLDL